MDLRSRGYMGPSYAQPWREPSKTDLARNTLLSKIRRARKSWNFFRLVIALIVTCYCFFVMGHYQERTAVQEQSFLNAIAREQIKESCAALEALRNDESCYESFDLRRGTRQTEGPFHHQAQSGYNVADDEWLSAYNAVLDYQTSYDAAAAIEGPSYTTRRTLKCTTGFSMSIIWDLEFDNGLDEYGYGVAMNVNATDGEGANESEPTAACPRSTRDSSAKINVLVDCGFNVKTDTWGNPQTEQDHENVETCTKMAWTWVKGKIDEREVQPWKDLCLEGNDKTLRCDRDIFKMRHIGVFP